MWTSIKCINQLLNLFLWPRRCKWGRLILFDRSFGLSNPFYSMDIQAGIFLVAKSLDSTQAEVIYDSFWWFCWINWHIQQLCSLPKESRYSCWCVVEGYYQIEGTINVERCAKEIFRNPTELKILWLSTNDHQCASNWMAWDIVWKVATRPRTIWWRLLNWA